MTCRLLKTKATVRGSESEPCLIGLVEAREVVSVVINRLVAMGIY